MQTFSRLSQTFLPQHYDLSLTINREERTFTGLITIEGNLLSGDYIPLHAKDLTITQVTINGMPGTHSHHEYDELHLHTDNLVPGEYITVIEFSGTITDAMTGIYPCYFDHNGTDKELIATQFESHHAREAFPCVDEPEAKATFSLTLSTESGVEVLSNMPIKKQTAGDLTVTQFETTPKMSTYLLAWVVGELHKKTARTKRGIEVNVWATPTQPEDSLDFALDIATRCIDFYEEYFNIPYPLPKCDHVALPDFSSGAMENWGLITYREIALLANRKSGIDTKRYIATVICHELAHQWFGNLVTMRWWDDLWLNESFATMMEYVAVDALEPDWHIWRDFASSEAVMALRRDSLAGVQPVHVPVTHPDEISTLFDGAIVYAKGAKLMRMLQHYIGHDDFRTGLTAYFTQHAYNNTEGKDLWNALATASGKDISHIMETWISQSGFPLVTITEKAGKVALTQEQFFVGPHKPSDQLWPIPLSSTDPALPPLFTKQKETITNTKPFFLNNEDTSYFITRYPESFITKRLDSIVNETASEITRLQFLHEQSLLAKAGIIPLAAMIPILQVYVNETNEAVWGIISLVIAELRRTVEGDKEGEVLLKEFVKKLVEKQFNRLGWKPQKNESDNDTVLRGTIVALMLYTEDEAAIKAAHTLYLSKPIAFHSPELRSSLIANEVRHYHSHTIVKELLSYYADESNSEIQSDIAVGATAARTPESIAHILRALQNKNLIRPQDVFRWFAYMMRNHHARTATWQWLRTNWDWIEKTFASDKSLDTFPRYAANALATPEELEEYSTFFAPHAKNPSLARAIEIGIGEIKGRIEQIARDKEAIKNALRP